MRTLRAPAPEWPKDRGLNAIKAVPGHGFQVVLRNILLIICIV